MSRPTLEEIYEIKEHLIDLKDVMIINQNAKDGTFFDDSVADYYIDGDIINGKLDDDGLKLVEKTLSALQIYEKYPHLDIGIFFHSIESVKNNLDTFGLDDDDFNYLITKNGFGTILSYYAAENGYPDISVDIASEFDYEFDECMSVGSHVPYELDILLTSVKAGYENEAIEQAKKTDSIINYPIDCERLFGRDFMYKVTGKPEPLEHHSSSCPTCGQLIN